MNQKGEVTLMSVLIVLGLMGLVLLCGLELRKNFKLLEKRTKLYLCVKETKGEHHEFLEFMGRTNWGIKNINRLALIMLFIPGLQGVAANADRAKEVLKSLQTLRLISYLKTLSSLRNKGCPLDPRMFMTPYKLGGSIFQRDVEGAAILKEKEWTYYYFSKPYLLNLKVNARGLEATKPRIEYLAEEKGGKLSSLLSSR